MQTAAVQPSAILQLPQTAEQPQAREEAQLPAEQSTQPVLYADFSPDQLARTIRSLEKSDAGGLIPHIFAVRALFPKALAGANPRTAQIVEHAARSLRAPLDRFFVRLRMPRLAITAKDLEDRESRFALSDLVGAVVDAAPIAPAPREAGIVRVSGSPNRDTLREVRPELESAPLGSVLPWSINAEMLGTHIEYGGDSSSGGVVGSDVIAMYRLQVRKVFGVLETLPMDEFHRVLSSSVNRTLDEALNAVLETLRAAAHVVVD